MNIFAEKGIRDVADVTLYSINRIGTEEFYLPVLYLDSLKLTNFSKSVATNESFGGIGNRKTVSWSYTKDIKLKVEDALFTQASLSMLIAGQLAQKMSPWTSAIAKLMVANKYGRNSYSTKAYPSPQLTDEEWEIVFRCAQKAVFDPRSTEDETVANPTKYLYSKHEEDNESVAENRWLLQKHYMQRDQVEEIDIAPYMDIAEGVEGLSVVVKMTEQDKEATKQFFDNFIRQSNIGDIQALLLPTERSQIKICSSDGIIYAIPCALTILLKHDYNGAKIEFAFLEYPPDTDPPLFSNAYLDDDQTFVAPIGNENFYSDFLRLLMSPYSKPLAMPQKIIDLISDEVRDNKNFGYQSNCLKEVKKIDHFEQCTVTDPNGLKIDIVEQNENIRKMYRNDIDNYIVYYDEKTMMPFTESTPLDETIKNQKAILVSRLDYPSGIDYENAKKNKFIDKIKPYLLKAYGTAAEDWINSLTPEDIVITKTIAPSGVYTIQYFLVTKRQYFTLKYGTTYYKKTRVIDTDDNDITFLGIDVPIDYDTFSGEYMIVGKTEVKDQATGKDSPCQIIFNRTAISSSTALNLSGKGEPATFSFDVAILDPIDENKNAVELIFYKTEKDEHEGGERVVPQSKRYARTPILQTKEEVVAANEEIY